MTGSTEEGYLLTDKNYLVERERFLQGDKNQWPICTVQKGGTNHTLWWLPGNHALNMGL
jgi:hypothetical protein